jgi:hypothetical protein
MAMMIIVIVIIMTTTTTTTTTTVIKIVKMGHNRGSFCFSVLSLDSVYAIQHTQTLNRDFYSLIIRIL